MTAYSIDAVLEVLLAARTPPEPKRRLRTQLTLDFLEYIYSGGPVVVVRSGVSAYSEGPPLLAPIASPVVCRLMARLRCASIAAHPDVKPKLEKALLGLSASTSMAHLRNFLLGTGDGGDLSSAIVAESHVRQATNAYKEFTSVVHRSLRSTRTQSKTVPWVVPDHLLEQVSVRRLDGLPSQARDALAGLSARCPSPASWDMWLPWLSLGAIDAMSRMQSSTIDAVRRGIYAFAFFMDPASASMPLWDKAISPDWLTVPTYAVYPFRREARVRKALETLSSHGIRVMRDLRCLHPDAVYFSKVPTKPLLRLYSAFRKTETSTTTSTSNIF